LRTHQGDDFQIVLAPVLGPYLMVAIVLAHKRRMSAKALLKVLQQHGGTPRQGFNLGEHDILIPHEDGHEDRAHELMAAVLLWAENIDPTRN
jgi:hypothetical protein